MADEFICIIKRDRIDESRRFHSWREEAVFKKIGIGTSVKIFDINGLMIGLARLTKDGFLEVHSLETGAYKIFVSFDAFENIPAVVITPDGKKVLTVPLKVKADHKHGFVFSTRKGAETVVTTSPTVMHT